jgi:prostaglandin-E synthase 1
LPAAGIVETILDNPAFRSYAVCSAILVLKMLFSAVYTGSRRQVSQGYINREDANVFGKQGVNAAEAEAPTVAHALRIQRNDLENIPAFFAIGLVYVLSGATAVGAAAYFWTFTVARVLHTIMYMNHLQPWRAICFGVGALCTIGMCVQILMRML